MSTPRLVRDIRPDSNGSNPGWLTAVGSTLFFTADDGVNGYQLWRSDGTAGGTQLVASSRRFSSGPANLTALGSTLFFSANDGISGTELWKSNGTAVGTSQLVDLLPGKSGSYPGFLTSVDKLLYFTTLGRSDGAYHALWRSDGTASGTIRLIDEEYVGGTGSAFPELIGSGNTLYFSGRDRIWISDGTYQGTSRLVNGGFPNTLFPLRNTLFFASNLRYEDYPYGEELWKSDGTSVGTVLVADIRRGSSGSYPDKLTSLGDTLYFTADDGATGRELWKSNGTAGTTVRVADIRLGAQSSVPRYLTPVGSTLYFTAFDDSFGTELWKTDGTTAGTRRVADISLGSSSSTPRQLTAIGNTLYFTADDGITGRELWKTDGSEAGTVRVADIRSGFVGSNPANLTAVGTTLYFTADNGSNGRELWALDSVAPTLLSITARDADKSEGSSGLTAFRFTVSRSGDLSAPSSVRWAVTSAKPSGSLGAANAADFGGVLPSGIVRFRTGQRTAEIMVNVRGDRIQESDERFFVNLSDPSGALIGTGRATGVIRNDDLIGTAGSDTLIGGNRSEYIDGRAGADILIGGNGKDVFGFLSGESRIENPDRITDLQLGVDRIDLFEADGSARPAPLPFSRAANNRSATSLRQLTAAVFADADGFLSGRQPLAANAAALVVATQEDIRGTYLLINDADAALNPVSDLLINITGFRGTLPALGAIAVNSVFV